MSKNNFWSSFGPYIAGAVGSGVANQFSPLAPFSAAIGAGAGALTNSSNRLAGAAQGFAGGGVGSALGGGIKGAFSGTPGTSGLDNFGTGAMSGLQTFGNSIPGFGGVGTSNPTGAFAKFFSPSSSGVGQGTSANGFSLSPGTAASNTAYPSSLPSFSGTSGIGATSGAAGSPSGSLVGASQNGANPMSMFSSMLPGAAVALGGGLLAPQVAPPDYSGPMSQFQGQIDNSINPAAAAQYNSILNTPNGASAEGAVANAKLINDRAKAAADKSITDQFSANNGSTTGNTAYNNAITKSDSAYDANYEAQAQQAQFQADQLQSQQKLAAAQALQGMNDTQLNAYAQLDGLSVQQIQEKFTLDQATAASVKQIAATAGQLMMEKGLGLNQGFTVGK